jgi:hypothetical protein
MTRAVKEQAEDPPARRAGWSHDWQPRWSHEAGRKPLSAVPCSWQATRPLSLFAPFALSCVTISVFYTWMYNGTGGSLLIVILFHATSNLPLTVFLEPLKGQVLQPYWIYVALLTVAAAILVAATGPANLSRTQPKQVAVP